MVQKITATPSGTRALQRLTITPPPPVRAASNRVGVHPVEKRRAAMGLLDDHRGTKRARAALHELVGEAPPLAAPSDDLRRPRGTGDAVSPDSAVGEWMAQRAQVTAQGPRGSNYLTEPGVARNLQSVDQRFRDTREQLLAEARAGLDDRLGDHPQDPRLGTDMPEPSRAEQLRNVAERVRHDLAQFTAYARKAMDTEDRGLADQLVSVALANTSGDGPWAKSPTYETVMGDEFGQGAPGLVEELDEYFLTAKGAAGEVAPTLDALQRQELAALENALADPVMAANVGTLLAARAYRWLQGPPPDADAAARYAELVRLATPLATEPNHLDSTGTRITSIDAEAHGNRQFAGDRGSRGT